MADMMFALRMRLDGSSNRGKEIRDNVKGATAPEHRALGWKQRDERDMKGSQDISPPYIEAYQAHVSTALNNVSALDETRPLSGSAVVRQ